MRSIYVSLTTIGLLTLVALATEPASEPNTEIGKRLMTDITYLSSDELGGRPSGGAGCELAARYIAEQLAKAGVKPAGDTKEDKTLFSSAFDFAAGVKVQPDCALMWKHPNDTTTLKLDADFSPFGFSSTGEVDGEVVFCGYGISAPGVGYDDYDGLDVQGKVVIVYDGLPGGDKVDEKFSTSLVRYGQVRYKAMNARVHGARAVIVAARAGGGDEDPALISTQGARVKGDAGVLVLDVRRSLITKLASTDGDTLGELQVLIDQEGKPASAPVRNLRAKVGINLKRHFAHTENVLGVVPGTDPGLAKEVIVMGAHYDHLGDGSQGGSLHAESGIHHGADDNASGVSAVLEVARDVAKNPARRTVLFAFFSAEELGLLGSASYVKTPAFPITDTVAMINLDMVGRMRNGGMTVGGAGTSAQWETLIERAREPLGVKVKLDPEGFGPSDHSSFYSKQVPVMFLFTGAHVDYHKPSDTADKINTEGLVVVTQLATRLVREIDALDVRPSFQRTTGSRHAGRQTVRGTGVYLGTIPDYSDNAGKGLRLNGVRDNSPASKAGLVAGDVVVSFAGQQVRDVYDYTYLLFAKKPGDTIEIKVVRDGETLTLTAILGRKGGKKPAPGGPHGTPPKGDHGKHAPAPEGENKPQLPPGHP